MYFSHFDVRVLDKSEGESLLDMTIRHLISGIRSLLFNYISVILHVLGDPIDTIWSLLDKLALV